MEFFFNIIYNEDGDDFMENNDIKKELNKNLDKINDLWRSL